MFLKDCQQFSSSFISHPNFNAFERSVLILENLFATLCSDRKDRVRRYIVDWLDLSVQVSIRHRQTKNLLRPCHTHGQTNIVRFPFLLRIQAGLASPCWCTNEVRLWFLTQNVRRLKFLVWLDKVDISTTVDDGVDRDRKLLEVLLR